MNLGTWCSAYIVSASMFDISGSKCMPRATANHHACIYQIMFLTVATVHTNRPVLSRARGVEARAPDTASWICSRHFCNLKRRKLSHRQSTSMCKSKPSRRLAEFTPCCAAATVTDPTSAERSLLRRRIAPHAYHPNTSDNTHGDGRPTQACM